MCFCVRFVLTLCCVRFLISSISLSLISLPSAGSVAASGYSELSVQDKFCVRFVLALC